MRVLLRILAPLLGLGLAAVGALAVLEVVAAWVRPAATSGLVVPWPAWRAVLEDRTWREFPVPLIAIGVGVVGLLLLLVGFLARRHDVALTASTPEVTVTTSPRVLARLVGRQVRAADDVAAASVTASARKVKVDAQGWNGAGPELRRSVGEQVDAVLEALPLTRRPRVAVAVRGRRGPR